MRFSERGKNILLLTATVVLTLAVSEIALRLWHGISPLDRTNFRDRRPAADRVTVRAGATRIADLAGIIRYDSTLGWTLKAGLSEPGFHTVDHGIRRSNAGQAGLRPGNVLAVGPSTTLGLGIADEQTWPAQLERLAGIPVDNAGVPGFALDQIVLRAEQLLPLVHPRALLVEFGSFGVKLAGQSMTFAPKPYFTVEDRSLLPHNIPVVPPTARRDPLEPIKAALGYSHLVDRVMTRIDPEGWLSNTNGVKYRVDNDPADVSCRLLEQLKKQAETLHTHAILVITSVAAEIKRAAQSSVGIDRVKRCAVAMGYSLVDVSAAFRTAARANVERLDEYYLTGTHFSELGNRRVAEMVAAALRADRLLGE
jgi:hypothetical protein